MKNLNFLLLYSVLLLAACKKESPQLRAGDDLQLINAMDFRNDSGCFDFCNLENMNTCCSNFTNCNDLKGKKSLSFILGPPNITMTGQEPGEPIPDVFGFCEPPIDQPFTFQIAGGFEGSAAVEVVPHLGRIQSALFDICVRPYIQESFDPLPPFLPGNAYEYYPPCGNLSGDWVVTAANGDEFWFNIDANTFPDCNNLALYKIEGQWIVTGGTGRFSDATGGGCVSGGGWANLFDPNPQAFDQWLLEGGIDY